jgi:SpoIIAA-like
VDRFEVTDEGGGIIRVEAESNLVRRSLAEAMCAEVESVAGDRGGFKILMDMGAMSKGTPGAGLYVLREMKKYDLEALALFKANGFMRGMAKTVLGLAGFRSFALFGEESEAREWLKNATAAGPRAGDGTGRLRQMAPSAALLGGGAVLSWLAVRRLRRARQ